jgi:chromosome segregation ATPase
MVSLKTAIVGGVSALALGTLVLGTTWISYIRTAKNEVASAVEDAIPIEFQLKRAQDMLDNDLKPEIQKMTHVVAETQIKVEHLEEDLVAQQEVLTKERRELMARNEELKSKKTTFLVGNVSYTKKELETDLTGRLGDVQTLERKLADDGKLLQARRTALQANEGKVEKLLKARDDLKNQIAELTSRVSALKATETLHESEFDDSKLSNVQDLLDSLKAKVEVREREMSIEGKRNDRIPVETEESTKSVVDSVDAYFGNEAPFEDTASN